MTLALLLLLAQSPFTKALDLPPVDELVVAHAGVGLSQRVVEVCEGQICYLRCSGSQRLAGSLVVTGTVTALSFTATAASGQNGFNCQAEGCRTRTGPDTYLFESGTDLNVSSTTGLFVNGAAEFGFTGTTDGMSYTSGSSTTNIRAGGNVRMTVSSTTITATGSVKVAAPNNATTCTLNGGSPSTCTATVTAAAVCHCSLNGATAAIAAQGCALGLSGTTLTVTSANASTQVVNIWCDR